MRISDWSSDVCSSDLRLHIRRGAVHGRSASSIPSSLSPKHGSESQPEAARSSSRLGSDRRESDDLRCPRATGPKSAAPLPHAMRSEEHTSELPSLMRISYAVFCLKKTKTLRPTEKKSRPQAP